MKNFRNGWLPFITGLTLCLTAAALGTIDALVPRTGRITLNITLLIGLFLMGLLLAVRGLSALIRNRKDS